MTKTFYSVRCEGDYEVFTILKYSDINTAKKAFSDLVRTIIRAYAMMGIRCERRDGERFVFISITDGPICFAGTEITLEESTVEFDDLD